MTNERNKYAYISSATTTQVATGPCILKKIIIGTAAAGTIGIIDNTTGTTVNVCEIEASAANKDIEFNIAMASGIRIVTGAASKITVVYSI